MDPIPSQQATEPKSEMRYLMLVGGLFVLIIGLLATLWVKERRLRVSAQWDVVQLRQRVEGLEKTLLTVSLDGLRLTTRPAAGQPASRPAPK